MKEYKPLVMVLMMLLAITQNSFAQAQNIDDKTKALQGIQKLFDNNQLSEALDKAKEAEDRFGSDERLLFLIGKIYLIQASGIQRYTGFAGYFRRDLLGEAEEHFRLALELNPKQIDILNHLSFTLVLLKNLPAGKDKALEVLGIDPKNVYALYLLGEISLLENNEKEAVKQFQKALKIHKDSLDSLAGLVRAFTELGKRQEAAETLILLLKQSPELDSAINLAYSIYEKPKLYKDAVILYENMVKTAPQQIRALFQKGTVEFRLERFEDAGRTFSEVIKLEPDHEGALYYTGALLVKEKKGEEASKYFLQTMDLEGDFFSSAVYQLHLKAITEVQANRYDRAFDLFEKILERSPSDTNVIANHALALSQAGQDEQAIVAYEKLLKLAPWDSSHVNNYALHHFGQKRTEKGVATLNKAIDQDENLDAIENLGAHYYYFEKNPMKSAPYFKRVLIGAPERTKALVLHTTIKLNLQTKKD